MGKQLRKLILGLAVLAFVSAWISAVATFIATDDVAPITISVTLAAFATEALIWALAILAGWSVFANRKTLFARLTGRKSAISEED